MKYLKLLFMAFIAGCSTKTVCVNGNESFQPVYDLKKNCSVRIRQTIIGSSVDLPKSISFKESEAMWRYRWVESQYKNGIVELGHFVLVPAGIEDAN